LTDLKIKMKQKLN